MWFTWANEPCIKEISYITNGTVTKGKQCFNKGPTLIEVITVLVTLGVVVVIAIPFKVFLKEKSVLKTVYCLKKCIQFI